MLDMIFIEDLDLSCMTTGAGMAKASRSIEGNPIRIGGQVFNHGVGTHSPSEMLIKLKGDAVEFRAHVGLDDETYGYGQANFQVWVDGKKTIESGPMRHGERAKLLEADLSGADILTLVVDDLGDNTWGHGDWADAHIVLRSDARRNPHAYYEVTSDPVPFLAFSNPRRTMIHGTRSIGATPGRPFLFRIPVTGQEPLTFSAKELPLGLILNPSTGILSGMLKQAGRIDVVITVQGPGGAAEGVLTILAGEGCLAPIPPMGWNSWNVWGTAIDAEKVRQAADALIQTGLAAHGFHYVNIDDGWQGERDANGEITPNNKFGDIAALADYVHSKGLKLGIYSSPGPKTCAGFEGSFGHEEQDAQVYARWGIDYLKYDWCSYERVVKQKTREELVKPYQVMQQALQKVDRDILYSLCQYGLGDVWQWGAMVNGSLWRTTGDISDSWPVMSRIGFGQHGREQYAGPGRWNDPDMLVVGKLGWGPTLRPTRLRPNEQITHITLWCLLAAPLLLGCDLTQLDAFTLALLTNSEVLAVNQDPLGKQGWRHYQDGELEVWARPLFDGSLAVGLFNRGSQESKVTALWSDLALQGKLPVRNLWLQRNLGLFEASFSAIVPGHGAMLIRIVNGSPWCPLS